MINVHRPSLEILPYSAECKIDFGSCVKEKWDWKRDFYKKTWTDYDGAAISSFLLNPPSSWEKREFRKESLWSKFWGRLNVHKFIINMEEIQKGKNVSWKFGRFWHSSENFGMSPDRFCQTLVYILKTWTKTFQNAEGWGCQQKSLLNFRPKLKKIPKKSSQISEKNEKWIK